MFLPKDYVECDLWQQPVQPVLGAVNGAVPGAREKWPAEDPYLQPVNERFYQEYCDSAADDRRFLVRHESSWAAHSSRNYC